MFTHVVTLAEKAGKHVELMVVPGIGPLRGGGADRRAAAIVAHRDGAFAQADALRAGRRRWALLGDNCPSRGLRFRSKSCSRTRTTSVFFNLGPHPPRLWPEDIDLAHRLWLELSASGPGAKLHHRDVIGVALRRMQSELDSGQADEVVADVMREISNGSKPPAGERR